MNVGISAATNVYREKTMIQKTEEGKLWEQIEREKAKQRMLSGGYPMDNVPQGEEGDKGTTRDIIASKVGIGSGRTYERAKEVVNKYYSFLLDKQGILY